MPGIDGNDDNEDLQNYLLNGPAFTAEDQLDDDLSPIKIHYEETIGGTEINDGLDGHFEVVLTNTSTDEELVYIVPSELPTGNGPVVYEVPIPFYTSTTPSGLQDGYYRLSIRTFITLGDSNDYGVVTRANGVITVDSTDPDVETVPPVWGTPVGVYDAHPYAGIFRSAWVQFGKATDAGSGLAGYTIYGLANTTETDPIEIIDDVDVVSVYVPNSTLDSVFNPYATTTHTWSWPIYDLEDDDWAPGATIRLVVTARDANGNETVPNNYLDCQLSYDETGPTWDNIDGIDTNTDDILKAQFGVNPSGSTGFMVYWGWADDIQTGVSAYRIYYSTSDSGSDGIFSDAEIASLTTAGNYIDTLSSTSFTSSTYKDFYLLKRFFFVPASSPSSTLYALVRAKNGEGDESDNQTIRNLGTIADATVFERLSVSTGLDPDFDSGDMAYKGKLDGSNGLFIVNPTKESIVHDTVNNPPTWWSPNIEGWKFGSPTDPDTDGDDPLDSYQWHRWPDYVDSSRWEASEPLRFNNSGARENMLQVSTHGEISASYNPSGPMFAFTSIGNVYNTSAQNGYMYVVNQNETNSIVFEQYDITSANNQLRAPCDLTPFTLGMSHVWPEATETNEVLTHAPMIMELPISYSFPTGTSSSEIYQIRDTGFRANNDWTMESVLRGDYFGSGFPAWTLYGGRPFGTSAWTLNLYWHSYDELFQSTSPVFSNEVYPDDNHDFSWDVLDPPGPAYSKVNDTGEYGLPATITLHEVGSSDVAYFLYASGSSSNDTDLALGRARASQTVEYKRPLSTFPRLTYDTEVSGPLNRTFHNRLDSCFGASLLDQRNGKFAGFPTTSGSWTPLEQEVPSGSRPSWSVDDNPPLCCVFVQAENTSDANPGTSVYYGEIYNHGNSTSSSPADAFVFFELVDSAEITDKDNGPASAPSTFKPIWTALGMYTKPTGKNDPRRLPVIAYGVDLGSGSGEVKVASLTVPLAFVSPESLPSIVGKWLYTTNPSGGGYSGGEYAVGPDGNSI